MPQVSPLSPSAGQTVTITGSIACSDRNGEATCPTGSRTITCFDQGAPVAVRGSARAFFPDYTFSVSVPNVIGGRRSFQVSESVACSGLRACAACICPACQHVSA